MEKVITLLLLIGNIFFTLFQISRFVEDDQIYHLLIASVNAAAVFVCFQMLRED